MHALVSGSEDSSFCREDAAVPAGLGDVCGAAVGGGRGGTEGATLVHDAGNLMGALRRYSELIARPGLPVDEQRQLARELRVLSERSSAVIEKLAQLGDGGERSGEEADFETTVLPDAVLGCLGLLSRIAGRAVTFFCAPSAYFSVAISGPDFERIVVQMVRDATKGAVRGEALAVTLMGMREAGDRCGMRVVLTVRDRAGSWGRREMGIGPLQELATSSGGVVEVERELGSATSVSVTWAAVDPQRARRKMEGRISPAGRRVSVNEMVRGLLPGERPSLATQLQARGEA